MKRVTARLLLLGLISHMLLAACLAAEPVIGFRNNGTGAYPDADPPLEWSASKNVKWRWDAPFAGETFATPIIVGNRVITMANPMTMIALDKDTGEELWRTERYRETTRGDDDVEWLLEDFAWKHYRHREVEGLLAPEFISKNGRAGKAGALVAAEKMLKPLVGAGKQDPEASAYFADVMARSVALREGVAADPERKAALEKEFAELTAWKDGLGKLFSAITFEWTHTCTPASDGERIYAMIVPGFLICVDLDGKPLWIHAICDEDDRALILTGEGKWGGSTLAQAPLCADGKVLAQAHGLVHCLDAASGDLLWSYRQTKTSRADLAVTPVVAKSGGTWYWMTGDSAVGRLADGEVLMQGEYGAKAHMYWPLARSADQRTFHYVRGAIRLPDSPDGKPEQLWAMSEELFSKNKAKRKDWIIEGGHSYFGPAVHDGLLYFFETVSGGRLTVMDAETGEVVYGPVIAEERAEELGGDFVKCSHSPRAAYSDLNIAGNHIFMFSEDGDSIVLKAGREFGVVGRNPPVGTTLVSSPMFEGRRMYVRTNWALFCFEEKVAGAR